MVRTGLIAFANNGGLGAQTRRLAKMLNPDLIMIVDSSGFSQNKEQHFEWYKDYNNFVVYGFPNNDQVKRFLKGLTHVFCVENPYNFGLIYWGQKQGTKIFVQSNYEFCDNLDKPWLPVPDKFLMPSYWKVKEMKDLFGQDRVQQLAPPIDPKEFEIVRNINMKRSGKVRFLHVIGTAAMLDRNGTIDLINSIEHTKADFELVIKSQHPLSMSIYIDDKRVSYEVNDTKDNYELFENFDVLILPRRWGGLSLTMNEAMMSGLPVITTNMSPQDMWIPQEWMVPVEFRGAFMARSPIEYYSADKIKLAQKIDEFATMKNLMEEKNIAFNIAQSSFSPEVLSQQYLNLLNDWES